MDTEDLPIDKDTLVVKISDLHSGGTTALFPDEIQYFKHGNHTPSEYQLRLYSHWEKCARIVSFLRKKKRLVIVHNGDAIDGVHHKSPQSVTTLKNEQIDLHVLLMKRFMKLVKFNSGDRLYYTTGTESHTNDNEDLIGRKMGAVMSKDLYVFDELELMVNGRRLWFAHKGPSPGKGANQGNALYNYIRDLWIDYKTNNKPTPDVVVFSHFHTARKRTHDRVVAGRINTLHGWILPSMQQKTRYAYGCVSLQMNDIGIAYHEITKSGDIINNDFELM